MGSPHIIVPIIWPLRCWPFIQPTMDSHQFAGGVTEMLEVLCQRVHPWRIDASCPVETWLLVESSSRAISTPTIAIAAATVTRPAMSHGDHGRFGDAAAGADRSVGVIAMSLILSVAS